MRGLNKFSLVSAISLLGEDFYTNPFVGLPNYPYPNPKNSNVAKQKREAKKRANIRARAKK